MSGDSHPLSTESDERPGLDGPGEDKPKKEKPRRELSLGSADMCVTTLQATVAKPEILLRVLRDALGADTFKLDVSLLSVLTSLYFAHHVVHKWRSGW